MPPVRRVVEDTRLNRVLQALTPKRYVVRHVAAPGLRLVWVPNRIGEPTRRRTPENELRLTAVGVGACMVFALASMVGFAMGVASMGGLDSQVRAVLLVGVLGFATVPWIVGWMVLGVLGEVVPADANAAADAAAEPGEVGA